MAGLDAGRWVTCALVTAVLLTGVSPRASAVEAFDGRIQAHGFVEMQIRALDKDFGEEIDLAQWYNVLNLELEFDILPDGWGPFDLLQAYVRIEGRYDAVYLGSQTGGAVLPSVRTWGDESRSLPKRLRDALDDDFGGVIDANRQSDPSGRVPVVPVTGPDRRNPITWVNIPVVPQTPVSYTTDDTGAPLGDPRNPVTCVAPGGPCTPNPAALQAIQVYNRNSGAQFGMEYLADCSVTTCRAAPYGLGPDPIRVSCAGPGDPINCPEFLRRNLGPATNRNPVGPQADTYHMLLDRGDQVVTDPITGETGTVSELYGNVTIDPNLNIFNTRVQGAGPNAASGNVCPPSGLPGTCSDNRASRDEIAKRQGFPGFDTLFDQAGPDGEIGRNQDYAAVADANAPLPEMGDSMAEAREALKPRWRALALENDDPADYMFTPIRGFAWTFKHIEGPRGGGQVGIMGPWLPKNFFQERAVLESRANPLRGRTTPVVLGGLAPNPGFFGDPGRIQRNAGVRFTALDDAAGLVFDPDNPGGGFIPDPANYPYMIDPVDERLITANELSIVSGDFGLAGFGPYPNRVIDQRFGGDFSGIIPCKEPLLTDPGHIDRTTLGTSDAMNQIRGGLTADQCIPFTNVAVSGGIGENPLRPAPDYSNLIGGLQLDTARGLFIPSPGLINYVQGGGDFDPHEFNINEMERSFNRGANQRETFEVKEAYLDMEFLDSRLWIRAGLQNIVWGKTELFRTTDQFNPVDLALASLPSLEEARFALLSARAVYSLYDVGPLEDVRLELAANFDRFRPADLGACGEPYTIDVVCLVTTGLSAHGLTGIGLAGVDRPPSAWNDVEGIEFGGRIEFRWDRFSFAIADFYGYNDFPYPDPIFFYDRLVDVNTGRPLKAGATGFCENAGGIRTENQLNTLPPGAPFYGQAFVETFHAGNPRLAALGDATALASGAATPGQPEDDYAKQLESMMIFGIGIDESCLKPGGLAGGPNENRFDPTLGGAGYVDADGNSRDPATFADYDTFIGTTVRQPNTNMGQWILEGSSVDPALTNHTANQQLFGFICLGTVGIAAAISQSSCAGNIFGSPNFLGPITIPLVEAISATLAGETGTPVQNFVNTLMFQSKSGAFTAPISFTPLNRDIFDGRSTLTAKDLVNCPNPIADPNCRQGDYGGTFSGGGGAFLENWATDPDNPGRKLSLDSTLTSEQRALLGCGPFYGTRCDSSVAVTVRRRLNGNPNAFLVSQVVYGNGAGGLDLINAEGGIVVGAFPGVEGTGPRPAGGEFVPFQETSLVNALDTDGDTVPDSNFPGVDDEGNITSWVTWSDLPQPGTLGNAGIIDANGDAVRTPEPFPNDVYCTRYAPGHPLADSFGLVKLPGCRGASSVTVNHQQETVDVIFEAGYDPGVDGCIFAPTVWDRRDPNPQNHVPYGVRAVDGGGNELSGFLDPCFNYTDTRFQPADPWSPPLNDSTVVVPGGRTLYHPYAGCVNSDVWRPDLIQQLCNIWNRDFDSELIEGVSQVFRTEMHAWSWNLLQFLVVSTCNSQSGGDDLDDPDCFDPTIPFAMDRCSFSQPQFCRNVKGFLSLAGVGRNDVRAGGNPLYGRRGFIWHSGGEAVLRYEQRNVLGFSMDFAEDVTKTNWGVEATWIGKVPFVDTNSTNFITDSSTVNLTVSVDRPTFINFLNANRTFFMNSQWFFQYVPNHGKGFGSSGPFNALFTFAIFTGYFQDRFLPQVVTVYDFRSRSAGFLPQVSYRFTEAFSMTFGVSFFTGRFESIPMAVRGLGPNVNRGAGVNRYDQGVERFISNIRFRDEAFMRLRWTF